MTLINLGILLVKRKTLLYTKTVNTDKYLSYKVVHRGITEPLYLCRVFPVRKERGTLRILGNELSYTKILPKIHKTEILEMSKESSITVIGV